MGYSPGGHKESDTTDHKHTQTHIQLDQIILPIFSSGHATIILHLYVILKLKV